MFGDLPGQDVASATHNGLGQAANCTTPPPPTSTRPATHVTHWLELSRDGQETDDAAILAGLEDTVEKDAQIAPYLADRYDFEGMRDCLM